MIDKGLRAVEVLARAEPAIALLDRTRPIGVATEYRRLVEAWQQGRLELPRLGYAPRRSLRPVQVALESIVERSATLGHEALWLGERASELLLEARMVEAVGSVGFITLACERFAQPEVKLRAELELTARTWLEQGTTEVESEPIFCSDDRSSTQSLYSVLSDRLGQLRLPIRIRVELDLMSTAACSESSVLIRGGTWLTARAAQRITEHEIAGHLLPRLSAKRRTDILHCGCAGASDDEEGRALLIEQRLGLMDPSRRAEIATRHLACTYLRRGANFVDAVRCLLGLGAPLETAIRSMLRASRGGGMGREIIYLPAMHRLKKAFTATPELEDWFHLGRASLRYAERLHRLNDAGYSISTQTGT